MPRRINRSKLYFTLSRNHETLSINIVYVCVIGAKISFEQRANIKFCFKIGKTFTETFRLMKQVYGDDCLSRSRVHEWFQRFQSGREDMNDDEHVGQPKSVIIENSIETVREFIKNQPKSSLKFMEIELNISKISIYRILMGFLHKLCRQRLLHTQRMGATTNEAHRSVGSLQN